MKSKQIKDERIVQLNNKIQSEAFLLVTLLLALSTFIKTYIMNMAVSEYIIELIIMIASLIYISIRSSIVGFSSIDTTKHGKKIMIIAVLGLSLIVSFSNGIRNYSLYGEKYTGLLDGHFLAMIGFTFASSVIFISLILALISSIDRVGQKKLEKKLENDKE